MLSLLSVVGSGRVITFFTCAEAQESDSYIGLCNGTRQCALGPILRPEILTLLPEVRFGLAIPFFTSAGPQEFNSDIDGNNGTWQYAL